MVDIFDNHSTDDEASDFGDEVFTQTFVSNHDPFFEDSVISDEFVGPLVDVLYANTGGHAPHWAHQPRGAPAATGARPTTVLGRMKEGLLSIRIGRTVRYFILVLCLYIYIFTKRSTRSGIVGDHAPVSGGVTASTLGFYDYRDFDIVTQEFYVPDGVVIGQSYNNTAVALSRQVALCQLPTQLTVYASNAAQWKRQMKRSIPLPSKKEILHTLDDVEGLSFKSADLSHNLCASMNEAMMQNSIASRRLPDRILEVSAAPDNEQIVEDRLTAILSHALGEQDTRLLHIEQEAFTAKLSLEGTLAKVHILHRDLEVTLRATKEDSALLGDGKPRGAVETVALLHRVRQYCEELIAFTYKVLPQIEGLREDVQNLDTSLKSMPSKFQTVSSLMISASEAAHNVNRTISKWFVSREVQRK
ncbi:hypothetical protein EIP86_009998 [Pleurotus ostreatoroseus]|nr:hypothetical protein EIP86_009998 [Pleurotus ostreatoroseus]